MKKISKPGSLWPLGDRVLLLTRLRTTYAWMGSVRTDRNTAPDWSQNGVPASTNNRTGFIAKDSSQADKQMDFYLNYP